MTTRISRIATAALLILLALSPALRAGEILVREYGFSLDLPEGWQPLDASDPAKLSFADETHGAVLQVTRFAHDPSLTAERMCRDIASRLKAQGDGEAFGFSGRDAYLADYTFKAGGRSQRGYVLAIRDPEGKGSGGPSDYVLIAFAPADGYEDAYDFIVSALDSFSPDAEGELLPGPLSQFLYAFPGGSPARRQITFMGRSLPIDLDANEIEAAQVVVEREARILASYGEEQDEAWVRFYRVVARDCYRRLDGISAGIAREIAARNIPKAETPLAILSWIQVFAYTRSQTLADFTSPLATAVAASGDCDSRVLLYVLVLRHIGVDAMLFVSSRYSHSVAGVDLDLPGAKMTVDGKKYLVAELTEKVDIGLIDRTMADASGWIPVRVGDPRR